MYIQIKVSNFKIKQIKRTLTSRSTGKTRQTTKTNYNRSISIALTRNKDKKVSFKTLKEKDEYDNLFKRINCKKTKRN